MKEKPQFFEVLRNLLVVYLKYLLFNENFLNRHTNPLTLRELSMDLK